MRLDFTPALLATVLVFVVVASVQFLSSLPGAQRGLLLFEKACPIHSIDGFQYEVKSTA
jgi:hypothetical protein